MTRNWFALASRTVSLLESRTEGPRRRGAGISLESLEVRLSLSALPAASVPVDLNPQPLKPGVVAQFRSLAPDAAGNKMAEPAVTHPVVIADVDMRKATGSQESIDLFQKIVIVDASLAPDVQGAHIGTNGAASSIIAII
jgi:hypothetical protein